MPLHMAYPIIAFMLLTIIGLAYLQIQAARDADKIDRLDKKLAEHLAADPRYTEED